MLKHTVVNTSKCFNVSTASFCVLYIFTLLMSACSSKSRHSDAVSTEIQNRRDFHQASAEVGGTKYVEGFRMMVAILPPPDGSTREYSNLPAGTILPPPGGSVVDDFNRSIQNLNQRHHILKTPGVSYWTPSIELTRRLLHNLMKNKPKQLKARALHTKPKAFACQVVGIEVKGARYVLYNFVPEKSQNMLSFYVRLETTRPLNWPVGGTVMIRESDGEIDWGTATQ